MGGIPFEDSLAPKITLSGLSSFLWNDFFARRVAMPYLGRLESME
jgi:hypothetical protein